jgi:hypothetical protein
MSLIYGWNTWASSLPKKYLVEFIIKGGYNQKIYLDDVLPRYYRHRSEISQQRMTHLYLFYIRDLFNTIFNKEPDVVCISEIFDFNFFLYTAARSTVSDAISSFPEHKRREVGELLSYELLHFVSEEYLFRKMVDAGVNKILKGSGQIGLTHQSNLANKVEIIEKGGDTIDFINSSPLDSDTKNKIIYRLRLWDSAKLLKTDSVSNSVFQMRPGLHKKLEDVLSYLKDKECSVLLSGSLANIPLKLSEDSDADLICFSERIIIPSCTNINIPSEVNKDFEQDKITEVSVSLVIDGQKISIRYIKPKTILGYFSITNSKHKLWRMTSLEKQGDHKLKFFDKNARAHTVHMKPESLYGGFLYRMISRNICGTLINPTVHMVLSGRIIIDNLALKQIKLELIRSLLKKSNKFGKNIVSITKKFPLAKDIEEEIESLCFLAK